MRDARKARDSCGDRLALDPHRERCGGGEARVLAVVRADHPGALRLEAEVEAGEVHLAGVSRKLERGNHGVRAVDDRCVAFALARKDAKLGGQVVLERTVAVEVVRRGVQEHRALGRKRRGVLELKARRLADHRGAGIEVVGQRGKRRADVPGDSNGLARGAPDVAGKLGHRRLAVGAGHRDEPVGDQPPCELELADDRDAEGEGAADRLRLARNPGALDDAPRFLDPSILITIQVDFDAGLAQPFGPLGASGVDSNDPLATLRQKPRGGLARAREPDHQVWPGGQGRSIPRRGHAL